MFGGSASLWPVWFRIHCWACHKTEMMSSAAGQSPGDLWFCKNFDRSKVQGQVFQKNITLQGSQGLSTGGTLTELR